MFRIGPQTKPENEVTSLKSSKIKHFLIQTIFHMSSKITTVNLDLKKEGKCSEVIVIFLVITITLQSLESLVARLSMK